MTSVFHKEGQESSLKRTIYNQILNDILYGHYEGNAHLTEKELVERFGVSKSPIREALIELSNEGLLRSIPRYGYEVTRVDEKDVHDAKNLRIILECGSLSHYWDLVTDEHIERIAQGQVPPQGEVSVLEHWGRNSRFHLELVGLYHNQGIYRAVEGALKLMTRAYVQFQVDVWRQRSFVGTARRHRDVLTFIKEGDKERAIATLRADIDSFVVG